MKNFFKTLFRNIKRNPLYSFINLFGLTLGFSCIIIISLWIQNELSFDAFHKNSEDIYRIHRYFYDPDGKENLHLPVVAPIVAPILEKEIKEIEHIARILHTGFTFSKDDKLSLEDEVCFAEPEILKIFTFEGLQDNEDLLKEPLTMIISDHQAMRYFNKLDVIGESIAFKDESGQKHELKISGVFKRWNQNSHFHPEFLISFITYSSYVGEIEMQDWGSNNYETFALIPHFPSNINVRLDAIIDEYLNNGTNWTKIRMEGLRDIHFNWHSNKSYVFILASISLLILIIGSINYMNLNVAIYTKRLGGIKMRKIMGASSKTLISQTIVESVLVCLAALLLAIWIVWLVLPELNFILGNPIQFNLGENITLIAGFFLLTVLTGVLSAVYPSIMLSSFKAVSTKINECLPSGNTSFRTGLVVFQFFVSITLIISFLIVFKQLSYIHHKELGLDQENIIVIPSTPQLIEKLDVFRQELVSNANVLSVSGSKRVPSNGLWDSNGAEIISGGEVSPLGFRLANVRADEYFLTTYGIRMAAGRNFDGKSPGHSNYLINESTVKQIGWESPDAAVGQVIRYGGKEGTVIGVIRDFHYESLHVPISPILIVNDPSTFDRISIRLTPHERQKTLAFIEESWQKYNIPNYSFSYEYVDDRYNKLYKNEENVKTILSYFMTIAISIAVLGLIGLSLFMIQRRVKEIGVRKVNGAKVWEVMAMLNRDFVKWVVIAFVIATPIAYYAMNKWLQNFAYKTELSWWIFALAGVLALGIALLTVSWQSWKAGTRNPVEALRYE